MKTYTVKNDYYGNTCYINEDGQLHREDGPAKEYPNGDKYWFLNGKFHRKNAPAIELTNGRKEWYKNGRWHREDGPAVEYPNGDKYWFLNGVPYTETDFNAKMNLSNKLIIKTMNPSKKIELTMTEINKHFGCQIKIVESH